LLVWLGWTRWRFSMKVSSTVGMALLDRGYLKRTVDPMETVFGVLGVGSTGR